MNSVHQRSMIRRGMVVCCSWMMALAGVNAAPAVEAVDMLFHHWSTRDGLPNNRVRGMARTRDGFIWLASDGTTAFATTRGFFRLHTDDFQSDTIRPPVFMEGVRTKGTRIDLSPSTISLPAGTDRLEFSFTGLNFHDPTRLKFRTRMKGLDDDWVLVGDRRVTDYRNLLPGTYQFQVEATSTSCSRPPAG